MDNKLTHFNEEGLSKMVDVSDKIVTHREARAKIEVHMDKDTIEKIRQGSISKGNVLAVAQVAGICAAKKNYELIPMCHQIPLTGVDIKYEYKDYGIEITSIVKTDYKTGVEMEALTACSIAALTIYDMCKAIDKKMYFTSCRLVYKEGGKSGVFEND